MSNEKQREAKEAIYIESNLDVRSVCNGQFYKKNSKTYELCKNCENCYKYKCYKDKSEDTPEVKFHYVDTFRKCEFYKVRPIDESYIITTSVYNILYVNDLACATIIDLCDKVKHQDKETQKIFSALRKRQVQYEKDISTILSREQDFLAEYNSYMDEKIGCKVEGLTNALVDEFKNKGFENYLFLALTEVMRTMVGYSVYNVENRVKECLKYEKDSVHLRQYKMLDTLRIAENFSDWVCRKCKYINLNECDNVMKAYRELDKTLTNPEIINEALFKAREYYKGDN